MGYYRIPGIETGTAVTVSVSLAANYTGKQRVIEVAPGSNEVTFWFEAASDWNENEYGAIIIGNQIWMAENLRASQFNDHSSITPVADNAQWADLSSPGYCSYPAIVDELYGYLYNWYTVNTGLLCPVGWHVPSDVEFTTLTTYLGGENVAGGKLKEAGTANWSSTNAGATNVTGFTALPGGHRINDGTFDFLGTDGFWWTSTESSGADAWLMTLGYNYNSMSRSNNWKKYGLSVRCINDINLPIVTTKTITGITANSATCGGNVTLEGGEDVTEKGVCWSTEPAPTSDLLTATSDGTGMGDFSSNITGLSPEILTT